ncbi:UNKNOWN [Stylonychia lemnae]|uniref:Transmembrane protein n=1 Tax=Stylonychia lemnae TaxID=5949 RepID=A0A077ZR78_STYLE|nr:UNKNOWN [Stylonychia lemnae]|eukprot:CDW71845.1 UNKNOWN [Stylonychia lemnae]
MMITTMILMNKIVRNQIFIFLDPIGVGAQFDLADFDEENIPHQKQPQKSDKDLPKTQSNNAFKKKQFEVKQEQFDDDEEDDNSDDDRYKSKKPPPKQNIQAQHNFKKKMPNPFSDEESEEKDRNSDMDQVYDKKKQIKKDEQKQQPLKSNMEMSNLKYKQEPAKKHQLKKESSKESSEYSYKSKNKQDNNNLSLKQQNSNKTDNDLKPDVQRKISNLSSGQQINLNNNSILSKKPVGQPQKRYGVYHDDDEEDEDDAVSQKWSNQDDNYSNRGKRAVAPITIDKKNSNHSSQLKQQNLQQQSPQFQQMNFYEEKKTAVTNSNNKAQSNVKRKKSSQKQLQDQDDESVTDKSIEIMESDTDNKSVKSKNPAKGFAKQKAIEVHNMDEHQNNHDDDEEENILDTNPENYLIEKTQKKRLSQKAENFFKFDYEDGEIPEHIQHQEEHGLNWDELDQLNEYFRTKKLKHQKRRRKSMKYLRARNLFFTSRWYMMFHFIQNVLFWLVILVFPTISVIGCDGGHKWMSHVAMAFYLGLFLIFDTVFACQYISRESARFDLKSYNKGKYYRQGKCCFMFTVYLKCFFEILMTQIGLFDLYTDMAFATLVQKEEFQTLALVSIFSLVLIAIPKMYSFALLLMMLFGQVREQDKKRKYATRIMIFNEFRMQAACIDYITHQKAKTDLFYGLYKLFFEDIPQFIVQAIFLVNTDCGRKYPNGIIYAGILMALFNTYFGMLYRFSRYCYSRKRLLAYQQKVEIKISNLSLSAYGFRNIRGRIHYNRKAQALNFTGQNYEYMALDEQGIKKYVSFMESFPKKDRIEFVDLNKMKFDNIRYVKQLFQGIDKNFKELRYMTIQQCFLSKSFILQLKNFLDGNDSLARISFVMNQMPEDDVYWTIETCLEHPNLEIIQIAERWVKSVSLDEGKSEKEKAILERPTNISICRGIYIRLQQNESLKILEIRYLTLSRNVLQAIFKGLQKNKHLLRLVLTNDALKLANQHEFQLLGEAIKLNQVLKHIDLSFNQNFDSSLAFNSEITDSLINTPNTPLQRIDITTISHEIMATYLGLMDHNPIVSVFVKGKLLEDVDIQDD